MTDIEKKLPVHHWETEHSFNDSLKRPPITPDTGYWTKWHSLVAIVAVLGVFFLVWAALSYAFGSCVTGDVTCAIIK